MRKRHGFVCSPCLITHHISLESATEAVRKYTERALDLTHAISLTRKRADLTLQVMQLLLIGIYLKSSAHNHIVIYGVVLATRASLNIGQYWVSFYKA